SMSGCCRITRPMVVAAQFGCAKRTPSARIGLMENYEPVMSFDTAAAFTYDDQLRGDEVDAVSFLAALAGDGPALELAIGTGRIALPLATRGLRVDGIDISAAMIGRLRAKP